MPDIGALPELWTTWPTGPGPESSSTSWQSGHSGQQLDRTLKRPAAFSESLGLSGKNDFALNWHLQTSSYTDWVRGPGSGAAENTIIVLILLRVSKLSLFPADSFQYLHCSAGRRTPTSHGLKTSENTSRSAGVHWTFETSYQSNSFRRETWLIMSLWITFTTTLRKNTSTISLLVWWTQFFLNVR